ncbi:hypothetical protein Nmel_010708 [Mimus melanotis]
MNSQGNSEGSERELPSVSGCDSSVPIPTVGTGSSPTHAGQPGRSGAAEAASSCPSLPSCVLGDVCLLALHPGELRDARPSSLRLCSLSSQAGPGCNGSVLLVLLGRRSQWQLRDRVGVQRFGPGAAPESPLHLSQRSRGDAGRWL